MKRTTLLAILATASVALALTACDNKTTETIKEKADDAK